MNRIQAETIEQEIVKMLLPKDRKAYTLEKVRKLLPKIPQVFVGQDVFNSRLDLVNLNNCAYDLVNFKPIPHSPEHFFTNKTCFDYDTKATCPEFDKVLEEYSLGDEDWIKTFWEIAGFIQTGDYKFHKMFWFTGKKGGNGKGTVLTILYNLVGEQFTLAGLTTKNLSDRFYMKNLVGKRLAYSGDLEKYVANVAIIKQITGEDAQLSDVKFGESVQFTNTAKIILAMNDLPSFPEDENLSPLGRRILILPFDYKIIKPDIEIRNKLLSELSGIFNKSMQGLKRLMQNKEFTSCKRGNSMLDEYLNKGTMFANFCNENLTFDPHLLNGQKRDSLWLYDIWELYCKYMDSNSAKGWDNKFGAITNSRGLLKQLMNTFPNIRTIHAHDKEKHSKMAKVLGLRKKSAKDILEDLINDNEILDDYLQEQIECLDKDIKDYREDF